MPVERDLDAGARGPADMGVLLGREHRAVTIERFDLALADS